MGSEGNKAAMRVLVVATSLARTSGGGRVYLEGLVQCLLKTDLQITVVVPAGAPWLGGASLSVMSVRPLVGMSRVARDIVMTGLWARRAGADVVVYPHEYAPPSMTPLIHVVQNVGPFHPLSRREFGRRGALIRALARYSTGAKATVAVSTSAGSTWELGLVGRRETSHVIPEPFHAEGAPPVETLTSTASMTDTRTVVVVGGAARYKNTGALRDVFVAAEEPRGLPVCVRVAGVQQGVGFGRSLGFVERPRLLQEFGRADLVVIPSLVESFGLPALEAACMGVRPVVLDGSAMAEWLDPHAIVVHSLKRDVPPLIEDLKGGGTFRLAQPAVADLRDRFSYGTVGRQWQQMIESVVHPI